MLWLWKKLSEFSSVIASNTTVFGRGIIDPCGILCQCLPIFSLPSLFWGAWCASTKCRIQTRAAAFYVLSGLKLYINQTYNQRSPQFDGKHHFQWQTVYQNAALTWFYVHVHVRKYVSCTWRVTSWRRTSSKLAKLHHISILQQFQIIAPVFQFWNFIYRPTVWLKRSMCLA